MFADFITSFISGRIRVRHPALHRAEAAAGCALLRLMPGVLSAEVNPRTGSLLLCYDPAQVDKDDLMRLGEQWVEQCGGMAAESCESEPSLPVVIERGVSLLKGRSGKRCLSRGISRGMLLSLGVSLIGGLTGRMGAHVVAGSLFVLLNAVHLHMYRKCL